MAFRSWVLSVPLCLGAAAFGQQAASPSGAAPIVQPGAPGESSKNLSPAATAAAPHEPHEADVKFMQGMIMHHGQAVEMTNLLRTRGHNKALLSLGERISISQTDEMEFMRQWLRERGKPESMDHMDHMANMAGMNHAGMNHMNMDSMLMPGMLTQQQMEALAKASGSAFDRLFLTGMIQHHTGALTMVKDLFATPGAGQDYQLYDFATDVDNTQTAEINIMKGMLQKEKK